MHFVARVMFAIKFPTDVPTTDKQYVQVNVWFVDAGSVTGLRLSGLFYSNNAGCTVNSDLAHDRILVLGKHLSRIKSSNTKAEEVSVVLNV